MFLHISYQQVLHLAEECSACHSSDRLASASPLPMEEPAPEDPWLQPACNTPAFAMFSQRRQLDTRHLPRQQGCLRCGTSRGRTLPCNERIAGQHSFLLLAVLVRSRMPEKTLTVPILISSTPYSNIVRWIWPISLTNCGSWSFGRTEMKPLISLAGIFANI